MKAPAAVAVVTVLALTSCGTTHPGAQTRTKSVSSPTDTPAVTATATTTEAVPPSESVSIPPRTRAAHLRAVRRLDRLVVIARRPPKGYARTKDFGSSWVDTDGNGCNQRDDVLLRDGEPGTVRVRRQGSCDHDVVAGTWVDPYTKRVHVMTNMKDLSQAQTVQIDHVVPLAEAWASGADRWSRTRRIRFANDLHELLAVDGPTNESKGDGDPAAWRPRKAYQCAYAERWIAVKTTWHLGADRSEINALREMLGYCRS